MRPAVFQRLVTWFAFAIAMLAPALARAAFLPACENHPESCAPQAVVLPAPRELPSDECSAGLDPQAPSAMPFGSLPVDVVKVAAMCDPRGASVVAPQRILPIVDARFDAVPEHEAIGTASVIAPGDKESPVSSSAFAVLEPAVLGGFEVFGAVFSALVPPYLPTAFVVRSAEPRGIDHPPR